MITSLPDLTPYAGRWVALVAGHVAGVGFTPEEARRLARYNRPKERFWLQFVEELEGEPLRLPELLTRLRPFLSQQEDPIYLVGGAVRDALLGRPGHDLDFAMPQQAIKLAFAVADFLGVPAYALDRERDTGRVVLPDGMTLDFARFRGPDLDHDLRDRDFTINALALPVTAVFRHSVIDRCGGLADLAARQLVPTHALALQDDPVRVLRAVRQAVSLDMSLPPGTQAAVQAAAPLLEQVSVERVRDELLKVMDTAVPHQAMHYLFDLGILPVVLPEIAALAEVTQSPPHYEPVLAHTLSVLRWLVVVETAVFTDLPLPDSLLTVRHHLSPYGETLGQHLDRVVDGMVGVNGRTLLRLGALFHDVGKRQTQSVEQNGRIRFLGHDKVGAAITLRRLHQLMLSNKASDHVRHIVSGHMRPLSLLQAQGNTPSRRAIYRFFRETHAAGLDIGLLSLADHLATYNGPGDGAQWEELVMLVTRLLGTYFDAYTETIAPLPLVNGHDLITDLQIHPGPEIGRLLRLIEEAQASGQLRTREEAIYFARQARQ